MKQLWLSIWNDQNAFIRVARAGLMGYALYRMAPGEFWNQVATAAAGGAAMLFGSSSKKDD